MADVHIGPEGGKLPKSHAAGDMWALRATIGGQKSGALEEAMHGWRGGVRALDRTAAGRC